MKSLNDPQTKKVFIIVLSIVLLISLILIVVFFIPKKSFAPQIPSSSPGSEEPIIIPLEYLSPEELDQLGVDSTIQAQIISRDPLIYKIINSEEDIVTDIRPLMQPLRE